MGCIEKIKELEDEIFRKNKELAEYKRLNFPSKEVINYSFLDFEGQSIDLATLFEDKKELIVIHNMGSTCSYCTMWADGFNGVLMHIENRAAFVVVSEDDPITQKRFSNQRGWNFRMASAKDNSFFKDMGFKSDDGELHPGISIFSKSHDNKIYRTNTANLGPFDNYCSVWHFFAMLPSGDNKWSPKQKYI